MVRSSNRRAFNDADDDSSDDDDDTDSSGGGSMPGLQQRDRNDSSDDDDDDDDDDDSDSDDDENSMPNLIVNPERDSDSSDDDDDSDDVPGLEPRYNPHDSSDSESDGGMPGLETRRQSSSDDDSSDDDSDDSSDDDDDDDEPPALVSRIDHNSSSDDDSDSEDEKLMPKNGRNNNNNNNNNNNKAKAKQNQTTTTTTTGGSGFGSGAFDIKGKLNSNNKKKKDEEAKRKKQREDGIAKRKAEAEAAKRKRKQERKAAEAAEERIRKAVAAAAAEKKRKVDAATATIKSFLQRVVLRRRWEGLRRGIIRIQALGRGRQTRKLNATQIIIKQVAEFLQFRRLWGNCIKLITQSSSSSAEGGIGIDREVPDWASLRDKQAYIRQQELVRDDEEEILMKETDERLTNSMADAMRVMEEKAATLDDDIEEVVGLPTVRPITKSNSNTNNNENINFKRIHLSGEVVKWLRNGDQKYIDFFIRRMKQLSSGERSRILAKRLNGSTTAKVPIYETYLEQKSGFRILWTEKDDYLLVWYVAKHQRVSRLMRLIDDSKSRSERQRVSIDDALFDEMKQEENGGVTDNNNNNNNTANNNNNNKHEDEIFLDPLGNVPLKVYDIGTDEIENIKKKNWTPALHLTEEERDVVETEGTVLLLGRSGTGKTICICNRMEYDRQQYSSSDPLFSQLFVARSPRLCTYVKKNIGETDGSEFVTFDTILQELEMALPKIDSIRDSFPEDLLMKFSTFKREVYDGGKGVDALIVWTNIRSFIKGSIEALQDQGNNFVVSEEEYLSEENFGKKRCRLSTEQRKIVYEVFLKYKEKTIETNAWDNCDRILALIQRLLAAKASHPELFEGLKSWCKWSKIYVDEVQDYTQSEILLFFHLSGAGNLFLAGDPAQNVTKGVEFRFDDIRSVGYHIAGDDRRLIPQKPKIVNVNFRSHAGILNAAASILSQMFTYFPDSAKQLGTDDGLFQGPRPGIFHKAKPETMAALVEKKMHGTVVLTHDENVDECIKKLGGYELVYGIRKAKGLEFKSVIVMDFFSSLPNELQKPWRELLLNRADIHDFKSNYPEVEGQLKLLYTAVTRCIDRLFFAETAGSISGDAFLRFMTNTESVKKDNNKNGNKLSIATKNKIGDIENMTMTQDEWLASGITNAEAAEAEISSDNDHARSLMEKAIYCFGQADNESFARKARIQLASFDLRLRVFNADRIGGGGGGGGVGTSSPDAAAADESSPRSDEVEKEAAQIIEKLLKENLLLEAKGLGRDIKHILQKAYPSSAFLERDVLQHLPGGGYNYAY